MTATTITITINNELSAKKQAKFKQMIEDALSLIDEQVAGVLEEECEEVGFNADDVWVESIAVV
jgi:hypothetical protein